MGNSSVGFFFFQAEDGIRDLVRSRGLGDVYKRQNIQLRTPTPGIVENYVALNPTGTEILFPGLNYCSCLLYTSDAADERSSVDLGGRRIIKKKKNVEKIGI